MSTLRSLDHCVIAVRDADQAGRSYERLGFQVLPLMRHLELGCCNRVVQLEGNYLELLGDIHRSVPALRERLEPRLACGEGLTLTSLTSTDLEQDLESLRRTHVDAGPIFNARRKVRLPGGGETETDSSALYAWRGSRLYGSFFYTQHRKPEAIWIAEYQRHPNAARRVVQIAFESDDPFADADYVSKLLGTGPMTSSAEDVLFHTGRGERIQFSTSSVLRAEFGNSVAASCASQAVLGRALQIEVADLELCRRTLLDNGVTTEIRRDRIRVPHNEACAVAIDFVERITTTY